MVRRKRAAGFSIARQALEAAMRARVGSHAPLSLERMRHLGQGLSRSAYRGWIEVEDADLTGAYVALVPLDPDPEVSVRATREAALLLHLERMQLPFRVPRLLGVVDIDGPILVERWMHGLAVEMRADRTSMLEPWAVLGSVAARIHRVVPPARLDGPRTRRAHVLAQVDAIGGSDPLLDRARRYAIEHAPPDDPSALLHGDLLGQNVLVADDLSSAVIDWEGAELGDPAHDLAIITRGSKRPFGVGDGRTRLVEAYREEGGFVTETEVRVQEVCLIAKWLETAFSNDDAHEIETNRHALQRLLGR